MKLVGILLMALGCIAFGLMYLIVLTGELSDIQRKFLPYGAAAAGLYVGIGWAMVVLGDE